MTWLGALVGWYRARHRRGGNPTTTSSSGGPVPRFGVLLRYSRDVSVFRQQCEATRYLPVPFQDRWDPADRGRVVVEEIEGE